MTIEFRQVPIDFATRCREIPVAFTVDSIIEPVATNEPGIVLREQGGLQLKIETQNVNVPACRFYMAQGCRLGAVVPGAHAYPLKYHHEYMLLWYLDL